MDLEIDLGGSDGKSLIRAINLSTKEKLIRLLNEACDEIRPKDHNARAKVGDEGKMNGIGRQSVGAKGRLGELMAISHPMAKGYNKEFTERWAIAAREFSKAQEVLSQPLHGSQKP